MERLLLEDVFENVIKFKAKYKVKDRTFDNFLVSSPSFWVVDI